MTGGTLVLCREIRQHKNYKMLLEEMGFKDVTVTNAYKNRLNRLIDELKPRLVLVSCDYYYSATPLMIRYLLKLFPYLTIAAVTISTYPANWAVKFIGNGVDSCVHWSDGPEQFREGLKRIRDGETFVSCSVQELVEAMMEYPKPTGNLTNRKTEVMVMVCNGHSIAQIAETLDVSTSTVNNHKSSIYYDFNVSNRNELLRVAQNLGIIKREGPYYYAVGSLPDPEEETTVRRDV
jgi:two-component system capsular synthesis response regulator RcsB